MTLFVSPSSILTNLRLSYTHDTAGAGSLMASLNVQNLFDSKPPVFGSAGRAYDQLGRRYSLGLRYRF